MSNETKFNILVGVIMGSYLTNEEKTELIKFVRDLEEKEGGIDEFNKKTNI